MNKNFDTWLLANGIKLRDLYDQSTIAAAWTRYLQDLFGGQQACQKHAMNQADKVLLAIDETNVSTSIRALNTLSLLLLSKFGKFIPRKPIDSHSLSTRAQPGHEGAIRLGGEYSERQNVIRTFSVRYMRYVKVADGDLKTAFLRAMNGSSIFCRIVEAFYTKHNDTITISATTEAPSGCFFLDPPRVGINKSKNTSTNAIMRTMIFEFCNAAHSTDFTDISSQLTDGIIKDPVRFAKSYEEIEYRSVLIAIDILTEGNDHADWNIEIPYLRTWGEHFKRQQSSGHTQHYIGEARRIKTDMRLRRLETRYQNGGIVARFMNDTKLKDKYGEDNVRLAVEEAQRAGKSSDSYVMSLLRKI